MPVRIYATEWETYDEAMEAADTFPFCGSCGADVKIQQARGRFNVVCIKNSAHNSSLSNRQ